MQIHPGIPISSTKQSSGDLKYHRYYLWVAMMLIIQGVSFHIPRGIWKYFEGSRVQMVLKEKERVFPEESTEAENQSETEKITKSDDMIYETSSSLKEDHSQVSCEDEKVKYDHKKMQRLLNYILSKSHYSYYRKLLICELLNLGNAIVQLLIMDMFVGFGLSSADLDILQLIRDRRPFQRSEAVEQMFPKISACTFYSYGPSGSIVNYQAVCYSINLHLKNTFCA